MPVCVTLTGSSMMESVMVQMKSFGASIDSPRCSVHSSGGAGGGGVGTAAARNPAAAATVVRRKFARLLRSSSLRAAALSRM